MAGSCGVGVGFGDSVEDLSCQDLMMEEGSGGGDGGREKGREMVGECEDFGRCQRAAEVRARGDVGPGGGREGEEEGKMIGGSVGRVYVAGSEGQALQEGGGNEEVVEKGLASGVEWGGVAGVDLEVWVEEAEAVEEDRWVSV